MSQILFIGDGKKIVVDRVFADNGKDAEYVIQGGQRIRLSEGTRKRPTIFQVGIEFFYENGDPVTKAEDIDYLPAKYRLQAEQFINKTNTTEVKSLLKQAPVTKGRGRPKKDVPTVIEITDAESYRRAGGVEV